jgi:hypothetical protein
MEEKALEIVPWPATNSLIAMHVDSDILQLQPPSVVYYRPSRAAEVVASILLAFGGAATVNPYLLGLAVIYGLLGLRNLRATPSPAECVVFSIVYNGHSHCIERPIAQQRFVEAVASLDGIEPPDFEPALLSLISLELLKQSGVWLEVADTVIVH